MSVERLLLRKFNLDPIAFESRYTVFDFQFFMDAIIEELKEEAKERERNDSDKLIRVLRIMKNMLNRFEF